MVERYPTSLKALILQKPSGPRKTVYNDVHIVQKSVPVLKRGEVLVRITAAGFNHREVCSGCIMMRKNVTLFYYSSGFAKVSIRGLSLVALWVQMGLVSAHISAGLHAQLSFLRDCHRLVRRSR
jgi:hypothetical protein